MTKLSDISPVNLAMHQFEQRAAEDELRYLMQRRDAQNEKIRFGLIALNGGSLLALMGALGGAGNAASWLGFTPQNALISSASFVLGLILSGIAVTSQQLVSHRSGRCERPGADASSPSSFVRSGSHARQSRSSWQRYGRIPQPSINWISVF